MMARVVRAIGSNVTHRQARLSLAIREAVRAYREHPCRDCAAEAWLWIARWEKTTGRTWTGDTPRPPAA